jgi:DNA-binding CsgD family transcriptional regulator
MDGSTRRPEGEVGLNVFAKIHQLHLMNVVVACEPPMFPDPSFDQAKPAPDPAASREALLVVSPDGRILFATAQAHVWMKDFFTGAGSRNRLPKELTSWLRDGIAEGHASRFIVDQSGRRLFVHLLCREADSVCLLLEQNPGISATLGASGALTRRQIEVLTWVARGKTNAEIAKILNLKPKTIGKYLERIYPKLGVENRTAAASFILGTDNVK